jgi:hypothetical protein
MGKPVDIKKITDAVKDRGKKRACGNDQVLVMGEVN